MIDKHPHQTADWQACAPGTLRGIAARARGRRRVRVLGQAAGAVVLLGVMGLTIWSVARPGGQPDNHFGGIACREVRGNVDAYMKGLLSPELADRMRVHLAECPRCKALMERMKMNMGGGVPGVAHRGRVECSCPRCRDSYGTPWLGHGGSHLSVPSRLVAAATR